MNPQPYPPTPTPGAYTVHHMLAPAAHHGALAATGTHIDTILALAAVLVAAAGVVIRVRTFKAMR